MSKATIYHQHFELTPSATSYTLVESLDKIANATLSDSTNIIKDNVRRNGTNSSTVLQNVHKRFEKIICEKDIQKSHELIVESSSMRLAKKYFNLWKSKTKLKRKNGGNDKKAKINIFLEQLKKQQQIKEEIINETKRENQNKTEKCPKYITKRQEDVSEIYKSRYKAQQNLIKTQKMKLLEQEEMIGNLKLGIILEETEKSLENSKYEIREIFKNCSERVKCQITPIEVTEKDTNIIELRSNKAPKIIAQMEKRAAEREMKRNIILQRKKLLDETKKKVVEEAIERKKVADEEERKKNLETIKERRRLENELEKRRQINKQKYLENINKANRFYKKMMKRTIYNSFKILMEMKFESELKSELFYKTLLQRKAMNNWKFFVKVKIEKENYDANLLYEYKLKKKVYKFWKLVVVTQKQSMQVAEDLYDMKLESRTFLHWHRYTCRQQMIEFKNFQKAAEHYNSKILLQYFYQWKSLPAVLQLEKAKEEKKRKWREKVWEIIPDYQPYNLDCSYIN